MAQEIKDLEEVILGPRHLGEGHWEMMSSGYLIGIK